MENTSYNMASHAEFLTRVTQITCAAQAGKLSTNIAGVVVNCDLLMCIFSSKQRKETRQRRETNSISFFFQIYFDHDNNNILS